MVDQRWWRCFGSVPKSRRQTAVLLVGFFQLSAAVHIQPVDEPIKAKDSDCMVILPCDFTTDIYENPQITWYQERIGERREIMRYNIKNHLSSYGEFLNRVARGDKGALVVFNPKSRDSGSYTCEVEIDHDTPSWMKNTVILEVVKVPDEEEATCPVYEKPSKGLIVAVVLFFLTSLACMFILGKRGITPNRHIWKTFMEKPRKQRVIFGLRAALVALVLCLLIIGLICIMYAFSSTARETVRRYERLGLAIGITGALSLVVTTILLTCPPARFRSLITKRKDSGDRASIPVEEPHREEHRCSGESEEEGATGLTDTFSCAVGVSIEKGTSVETSALLSQAREGFQESEIQTLPGPPGSDCAITGIVATSLRNLYVSTPKALFYVDLSKNETEERYTKVRDFQNELLMMEKSPDGVILCGRRKKSGMFTISPATEQYVIIMFRTSDKSVDKVTEINPFTWVYKGREDPFLYITDSMKGKIVKLNASGEKQEVIGERILQNPQCVVQNSSRQFIVTDVTKNDIFVFNPDGEFLNSMKITLPKNLENEVNGCNRLAVGPDDKIYAAGPSSRNILVFSADRRFENLLPLGSEKHDSITSLFVYQDLLYVAHKDCIRVYPLI
ncbi:uncharacterized protein LOC135462571 [Liolophura sinensis]|uniref:uncharacterized protein LOC135462571 n=1 Tax=Liolophura sinensis TaxID=3198878 RepID=UPI0031599173